MALYPANWARCTPAQDIWQKSTSHVQQVGRSPNSKCNNVQQHQCVQKREEFFIFVYLICSNWWMDGAVQRTFTCIIFLLLLFLCTCAQNHKYLNVKRRRLNKVHISGDYSIFSAVGNNLVMLYNIIGRLSVSSKLGIKLDGCACWAICQLPGDA